MNFPAALTAAQQGKTISRPSLPDAVELDVGRQQPRGHGGAARAAVPGRRRGRPPDERRRHGGRRLGGGVSRRVTKAAQGGAFGRPVPGVGAHRGRWRARLHRRAWPGCGRLRQARQGGRAMGAGARRFALVNGSRAPRGPGGLRRAGPRACRLGLSEAELRLECVRLIALGHICAGPGALAGATAAVALRRHARRLRARHRPGSARRQDGAADNGRRSAVPGFRS